MSDEQDAIDLPDDAAKQFMNMQQQLNTFLNGVRSALGVPDEYQFDAQRGAFVPPQDEGSANDDQ
jgi:hypothetical protein